MANKGVICTKNNVEYHTIRKAMVNGARTLKDLKEKAEVCGECDGCKKNLDYILTTLCSCKEVLMEEVVNLVKTNKNITLEEVMEKTQAGTGEDCGKCQKLINNVIELGY